MKHIMQMKPDALLLYILATCFGNFWPYAIAFVASPAASSRNTAPAAAAAAAAASPTHPRNIAELLAHTYPGAGRTSYMNDVTGSVSFQPHDEDEQSNGRAAVYDPGDELLRALNAEMAASGQELGTLPEEPDYADTVFNELEVANKYEMLRKLENDLREEQQVVTKSALLMKMLEDPNIETLPVIYVEEEDDDDGESNEQDVNNKDMYPLAAGGMAKRSRYYRRYPWKRHNRNRSTYEPELRYACTPTKEDVFKLLVNLHENRKGNHSKTVNFCNRKRPAKAIFTNIRFLG